MSTGLLVGLDVGTTTSKAVVFDEDGQIVSHARAPTPWTTTPTGAELDPAHLVRNTNEALRAALNDAPPGPLLGVGVTSMGESGVLLDRHGTAVAPIIAWHDNRDTADLGELDAAIGAGRFSETTGLPFRTQWSLTKHHWLLAAHPTASAGVRRLGIAEYIAHSLGGAQVSDVSLASRTGWLDLRRRTWWSDTLDWSGARRSLLPDLVDSGTALGAATGADGLPRLAGAVITVAGHDHQAAAIGAAAAGDGDELDSCGTAEALVRTISPGLPTDNIAALAAIGVTVGWHAVPGRWCLLGATTGGLTLQRVLAALGKTRADLPALDAQALTETTGLITIAQTPVGVDVLNITDSTTPAQIWRAALQTITDDIGCLHDQMSDLSGPHRSLVVTGGWSNSAALRDIKRHRLGPFTRPVAAEAGARGAALLAGMAAGHFSGPGEFPPLS